MDNITTDRSTWERARIELLTLEKAHSKAADALAAARRNLPKRRIEKTYAFDTLNGEATLADLFEGRSQLLVQHFMLAPGADAGCPMCSFWADGYNPMIVHMNQRDISFVAASRAPLQEIEAYRQRMGWSFQWVSSGNSSFNVDFSVSPSRQALAAGEWRYNYHNTKADLPDLPGTSVFERDGDGAVYHTYSTYGRGLDVLNAAYAYIDLTPRGRQESALPYPMAWVKRHDEY